MEAQKRHRIGFIGHGYVGKSYADNFENRGFSVVRYSLEEPYIKNKDQIQECDIVFVAVPTPTTPKGHQTGIVESALSLIRPGSIVVIKSTIVPGTTKRLQKKFPKLTILFSPEFLSVATAAEDTAKPFISVMGMPVSGQKHRAAAHTVLSILPKAPESIVCTSDEAEIYKYAHNVSGYTQILTFNLLYDMARHLKADWKKIEQAIKADPYVPNRYASPVHKSGRGAGGGCFIKDFAAFAKLHHTLIGHSHATAFMKAAEKHNIALLSETNKDIELLKGVYGASVVTKTRRTKRKTR